MAYRGLSNICTYINLASLLIQKTKLPQNQITQITVNRSVKNRNYQQKYLRSKDHFTKKTIETSFK